MKRKLLPLFLLSSSIAAAQQPNIVMLFVDDLGWSDLGYQNSEFETPNIDKLKHDGLYFKYSRKTVRRVALWLMWS